MDSPRDFERGEGAVFALSPTGPEVPAMRAALEERRRGALFAGGAMPRYRALIEARWAELLTAGFLAPGRLTAFPYDGPSRPVVNGDTLACGCSIGQECHRRWAAPYLARAGWDVILDGEPYALPSESAGARL
jgi:hypothetical protein